MKILEVDFDHITLLKLKGKMDLEAVDLLVNKTNDLLDNNRFKVIIDLEKVVFTDSTGLATFAAFLNEFKRKNGKIKLISSQSHGFALVELSRIYNEFNVAADTMSLN